MKGIEFEYVALFKYKYQNTCLKSIDVNLTFLGGEKNNHEKQYLENKIKLFQKHRKKLKSYFVDF